MMWHRSIQRRLSLCLIALLVLPVEALASTHLQTRFYLVIADQRNAQDANLSSEQQSASVSSSAPMPSIVNSQQPAPSKTQQPVSVDLQNQQKPAQPHTPLGAAAAPNTRADGVAASTPTGAAIAPRKQRRIKKFSIRTALVIGTVVAVGIMAGASAATSSRP